MGGPCDLVFATTLSTDPCCDKWQGSPAALRLPRKPTAEFGARRFPQRSGYTPTRGRCLPRTGSVPDSLCRGEIWAETIKSTSDASRLRPGAPPLRVSRGDEVNGLALNDPWIARPRDACLEPWGRTSKQPSRSHSWSVPMRTPSPASVSENTWPRQIAPQTTRTSQSRCGGRSTPHGSGDTFQSPRAGWRVLVSRSERRRRSGVAGVRQPALHSRLRRSGGRRPAAGERRGAQAGRARAVPERPSRRAR